MSKKPVGYQTRLLVADCETSGLFFSADNCAVNPKTGEYFQAVSWGLIVVDADTLKPIEELYLEVQWDGIALWNDRAANVHKLSKKYLAEHGVTRTEAVEAIANLIINHWGPDSPVCLVGHNPTFDQDFLKNDLRSEGLEVKFTSKKIDTNTLGFTVFGTHNLEDLIQEIGLPVRTHHNALEDARCALQVVQTVRELANAWFEG